ARTNAVPHIRMTGKGDFSARSKNSDVTRVAGFCRKDEGGLGEVELAGDLLHLMIRMTVRLGQYGQRITAEPRLGKHITDVVSIFHYSVEPPKDFATRQDYSRGCLRRDNLA